jgi:hypothetical protein
MVKLNYSKLTDEQLAKKEKENKGLVLVSVVTFLSLIYYFLREYFVENRINIFFGRCLNSYSCWNGSSLPESKRSQRGKEINGEI